MWQYTSKRRLTTDPLLCVTAVVDLWLKSADWSGLKISGSAHLWCLESYHITEVTQPHKAAFNSHSLTQPSERVISAH